MFLNKLLERQTLHFLLELVIVSRLKVVVIVPLRRLLRVLQRGLELQVDLLQVQQQLRLVRMKEPPVMVLVQVLPLRLQGDPPGRLSLLLRRLTSFLPLHLLKHLQEEQRDHPPQVQVLVLVFLVMPKPIML